MGVYFALRTHYDYPTGKYLRYFPEDDSILAWFQRHWHGKSEEGEEASQYADEILGCSVYGFDSLFRSIAEHNLTPPRTMRQLSAILNKHLYVEGEVLTSANAIQVLTDDDELELAYYFFDDQYLAENADKAAYLLHDDWQLPTEIEPVAGRLPALPNAVGSLASVSGQGTVYAMFLTFYDSSALTDIEGAYRIPGIRLTQFVTYLHDAAPDERWLPEMKLLRALTVSPDDAPNSGKTLADVLTESGRFPTSDLNFAADWSSFGEGTTATVDRIKLARMIAKIPTDRVPLSGEGSLIQAGEHVAQLCLHTATWADGADTVKLFTRWIFFDDVWLRAHPALGKAILRFGTRWDVLT